MVISLKYPGFDAWRGGGGLRFSSASLEKVSSSLWLHQIYRYSVEDLCRERRIGFEALLIVKQCRTLPLTLNPEKTVIGAT